MAVAQDFKDRLKKVRQEMNLTQAELAHMIGVSRASIGLYENGDRLPDIEILSRLCLYTGVSSAYFIGHVEAMYPNNEESSLILGFDDEVIGVLIDVDTFGFTNLVKHPSFIKLINAFAALVSPVLKPEVSSSLNEYIKTRMYCILGEIIEDTIHNRLDEAISNDKKAKCYLSKFLPYEDEDLERAYHLTEPYRKYISDIRNDKSSRTGSVLSDIIGVQNAIDSLNDAIQRDGEQIEQLKARQKICMDALERFLAKRAQLTKEAHIGKDK